MDPHPLQISNAQRQDEKASLHDAYSFAGNSAVISHFFEHVLTPQFCKERIQSSLVKLFSGCDRSAASVWEMISDSFQEAFEVESKFARAVLEKYSQWSGEGAALVLWDVDGTIGVRHVYNHRSELDRLQCSYSCSLSNFGSLPSMPLGSWGFRPSMLLLSELLPRLYPSINNGILSGRDLRELTTGLENPLELGAIAGFVGKFVHSSAVELRPGESPEAHQRNKVAVRENLRHQGINVKVIDDNDVAIVAAEAGNGLHVAQFAIDPRFSVIL